jgi:hypothetical protein
LSEAAHANLAKPLNSSWRAQRSNPEIHKRRKTWIAWSQGLLAMTCQNYARRYATRRGAKRTPWSETITSGFPRRTISFVSSRACATLAGFLVEERRFRH